MSEHKMFPLQTSRHAPTGPRQIPWSVAEIAYGEYSRRYGTGQSLQRLAERGGFGWCEMDEFHPKWREEVSEIMALRAELEKLREAVKKHHDQRADDRCFLDDAELYAAAGLESADVRVGDKDAMLENCKRFLAQRCEGGGPWKSYAELEAENAHLRASLDAALEGK